MLLRRYCSIDIADTSLHLWIHSGWQQSELPFVHSRLFSPADLHDHIFEASGVFIQHFASVFADHDSVRVSNASPVGIVDSWLAAESHAPLEDGLVAFSDPRGFVAFETN